MNKSQLFRLFAFLMAESMLLAACGAAQPATPAASSEKKVTGSGLECPEPKPSVDEGDATALFDQVWTEVKGGQ